MTSIGKKIGSAAVGLTALVGACAPGDSVGEGVGAKRSALYGELNKLWCPLPPGSPSGTSPQLGCPGSTPTMIPVCWEVDSHASAYNTLRGWVQDEISRTWQRHGRVNFVWKPTACSANDAGVHVHFNDVMGGGQYTFNGGVGRDGDGVTNGLRLPTCGLVNDSPPPDDDPVTGEDVATGEQCVRRVAVHEFGHALGFRHEEQSPEITNEGPECVNGEVWNIHGGVTLGSYDRLGAMSVCGGLTAAEKDYWKAKVLRPGDAAAVARAYGRRIPGTLLAQSGRCVASHGNVPGESPFLWDCDEAQDDQEWFYNHTTGTLRLGGTNLCLQSLAGNVTVNSCANNALTAQQWDFKDVRVRGWGGHCLDVDNGVVPGGTVQVWDCTPDGANQKWTFTSNRQLRYGNTNFCLTTSISTNDVWLQACGDPSLPNPNVQLFNPLTTAGHLVVQASGKCLDIPAPTDADYTTGGDYPLGLDNPGNGVIVQTSACNPSQHNQKWNLSGPIKHFASGQCLMRDHTKLASPLLTQSCDGGDDQQWDYYFR
jgi:hypothetical protein